ncbi:SET domain protein [Aspergillus campestris IBT 28561]|uniref:SET domain protein n=1 Tax=Aspergillus campestris (strain IBT 28561) TaxID=1392248 RepID=A0A2I1CYC8_ASPC2|nr:SET domain protein [Aspergillus campestris IBT 28561]PKY02612.1 SET domain protein [Aspergillus campestris IBT 28561]
MATDSGLPSSHNDATLTNYTALLQWMTTNGGDLHPAVQIARDDHRGVHLQVKQDQPPLPSNTEVIHTPLAATLSYFNAIDHRPANSAVAFPAHGFHLPQAFVDAVGPEETSIFFLIGQYLRGEDGFWAPYLRSLPQPGDLTTPLYYEGGDLEWLGGTSLLAAREQKRVLLLGKYEAGVRELGRVGFEGVERFTWDLYLWASTIFVSRAFSSKVLSGVIPDSDLPEESVSVLLPFIDVLNHRPLAKVEWRAGKDDVAFLTRENVAAGEEIANNYGPRNNEQLMMNYGFCLSGNPCDYRTVGLRAPPGSPLYVARQHQHQMYPQLAADADDHYYVFNVFYPLLAPDTAMEHSVFSPALFNAVSVLAANNRELETLEISEAGIRIPDGYGNSRTILSALSQIIIELITHIVKLKTSAPDSPTPTNLKQTHAKIYRDSQILLSETALVIASWTLNRARQHNYRGSWDETKTLLSAHMRGIPAGKFSNEVQSRVQVKILERPSLLHDNGELFSADELVRLLPSEMQDPARVSFQQISTTAERAVPALRDSPDASPFAFPMFLCLVAAAHRNSVRLSSRLGKWVGFLLEHYPPPPEDVLWAVEDEDDEYLLSAFDEALETMREQSEAAFSGLGAFTGDWKGDSWWLSPNWLRWAWMAVEQESVQVPDNPLGLLSGGAGGQVMLSTVNYLYVPEDHRS